MASIVIPRNHVFNRNVLPQLVKRGNVHDEIRRILYKKYEFLPVRPTATNVDKINEKWIHVYIDHNFYFMHKINYRMKEVIKIIYNDCGCGHLYR